MSKILKIISIIWLLICISLAAIGISQSHGGNPEGGIAPAIAVTFLTFPLGFIVQLAYIGILNLLTASNASIGLAGDILLYSIMITSGYCQWFILVPKAVKKMRKNQSQKI